MITIITATSQTRLASKQQTHRQASQASQTASSAAAAAAAEAAAAAAAAVEQSRIPAAVLVIAIGDVGVS